LIENLTIYPQNMQRNLENLGGLVFSQRVMLALIDEAEISREDAYKIVQSNAMKIWAKEATSFLELLKGEPEIMQKLGEKKLTELFDLKYHIKHVDDIFNAVFK